VPYFSFVAVATAQMQEQQDVGASHPLSPPVGAPHGSAGALPEARQH